MIDSKGDLHMFFGYGDSQLIHEKLEINHLLKKEKVAIPEVPRLSQSIKRIITPKRSHPSVQLQDKNLNFHKFQMAEASSPMVSTDINISPNIFPNKKEKIRSIKAGMYQASPQRQKGDDNFFYRRKNSQTRGASNDRNSEHYHSTPSMPVGMGKKAYSHVDTDTSQHFKSGFNSMYGSATNDNTFQYVPGQKKFNFP